MNSGRAVTELTSDMPGTYLATTQSGSRYLVEIDESKAVRIHRTPADFTMSAVWSPSLYSDGGVLPCSFIQFKVGLPGAFSFFKVEKALEDPLYLGSTRLTTIIDSIKRVDAS